jgi:hypothetical protein
MYGATTNNVVEQVFSWLKEERSLTPYFALKQILFKISDYNIKCMAETKNEKGKYLNKYAQQRLDMNKQASANFKDVEILGKVCDTCAIYIVRPNTNQHHSMNVTYNVDVLKRECTCKLWQQLGIPCQHAFSPIELHLSWRRERIESEEERTKANIYNYVDKRLYSAATKQMYDEIPEFTNWVPPGEATSLAEFQSNADISIMTIPHTERVDKSNKRLRSRGESETRRATRNKTTLYKCPCCEREMVSSSITSHKPGLSCSCEKNRAKLSMPKRKQLQDHWKQHYDELNYQPYHMDSGHIALLLQESFLKKDGFNEQYEE